MGEKVTLEQTGRVHSTTENQKAQKIILKYPHAQKARSSLINLFRVYEQYTEGGAA